MIIKNPFFTLFIFVTTCVVSQNNTRELTNVLHENTTLTKNTTYLVNDFITVSNNAILTIEEGVVFRNVNDGQVIIILEEQAKLIAQGSYKAPITAVTANGDAESSIIVKPSTSFDTDFASNVTNNFRYNGFKNPTILINPNDVENTKIAMNEIEF